MLEKRYSILLLVVFTSVIGYLIWVSEGFHGGGDSLAHYRIAKFSWLHPMYLLDHWGKPFFTLLVMPFTLLGFKGIQFFNLLCGVLSAVLVLDIARILGLKNRWLAVPIVLITPIFMQEFFSGLTEAAFAMLLLLVLWLRLKKHYRSSLVLLSFLPFVRTEAVLFLVWFGALDVFERRSPQTVLLLFGTIVYSLIGWLAKGDVLWLLHEMPYTGGEHIYGSGSLFHYLVLMPETIGRIVLMSAGLGLLFLFGPLLYQRKDAIWLLKYVVIPMLLYVAFHSIMWYVGRVSLGLPRMLAVIVPFLALLSVYFINRIGDSLQNRSVVNVLAMGMMALMLMKSYRYMELPVPLGDEEKVLKEVADYIRAKGLDSHKTHYYSLYNEISLGLDPHNEQQCQQVIHTRAEPQRGVASGSLVIWDAHFAPNEGAMPLENLRSNPYFEVLKVFKPEVPFNTLGDEAFEVYLFLRK